MKAQIRIAKGNIVRETEKAILLSFGDERDDGQWFPKSQIEIELNESQPEYCRQGSITMPIWLAKKKGLWGYNSFGEPICKLLD